MTDLTTAAEEEAAEAKGAAEAAGAAEATTFKYSPFSDFDIECTAGVAAEIATI